MKQIVAELIVGIEDAFALLAAAVAHNTDANTLHAALQAQIQAAKVTGTHPIAIRLATAALAGVEGEKLAKELDQDSKKH